MGPDTHPEMLKRVPDILTFCVTQHSIKNEHLDLLWLWTTGDHEYAVKIAVDIIVTLGSVLNLKEVRLLADAVTFSRFAQILCLLSSQLAYLYSLMERMPLEKMNASFLTLVTDYCDAALRNQYKRKSQHVDAGELTPFGLALLWDTFQDKTIPRLPAPSEELAEQARMALGRLLKLYACGLLASFE